ncbi:hypothetical protein FA15DRAFT_445104 [Coprinopsis marcescibilis]|uniref:Peptidase C14 n=1 Tax=Coprinopsis marcescibilis TaxID=230819 RepID=A0A5C3KTK7_COPMA|nr:hypothetical protein FA15DRAFT_445104 [Coprinopsis marcescibilis]
MRRTPTRHHESLAFLHGIQAGTLKNSKYPNEWPVFPVSLALNFVKPVTKRRALLICITYRDTQLQDRLKLNKPHSDGEMAKALLLEKGYEEHEIVVLTDARGTPEHLRPTRANIMRELEEFVKSDVKDYFFLYAGHSGQKKQIISEDLMKRWSDKTFEGIGKEEDEHDEYIVPVDAVKGPSLEDIDDGLESIILDDELNRYLIRPLPLGAIFLAVLDCCHSATLLDLKHHRCNRFWTWTSKARRAFRKLVVEPITSVYGDPNVTPCDSFHIPGMPRRQWCDGWCPRRDHGTKSLAICLAACKDGQTMYEGHLPTLTEIFVEHMSTQSDRRLRDLVLAAIENNIEQSRFINETIKKTRKNTMYELDLDRLRDLEAVKEELDRAGSPTPQLSSNHPLRLDEPLPGPWRRRVLN